MKKLLLFLILSVFYSASYCQTFHFNPGIAYSRLDWKYKYQEGNEQQYDSHLISYSFSAGVNYIEHKYYSVSSDLLFYRSGGKYSSEEKSTDFIFVSPEKISVSYISFGSSFNYTPLNDKFKLQLSLGPRIDYMVNGAKEVPLDWIDKRNGLNKFNFGYTAGLGLFYNLDDYTVGLNAQYLNRMKKLAKLEPSAPPQFTYGGVEASEQIILFGFSFGYRIK